MLKALWEQCFCLCSPFGFHHLEHTSHHLRQSSFTIPTPTPSSLIYFSNRRCPWWSCINHSDVSTLYTHPSGMIWNILRCDIQSAYPAAGGGGGGNETQPDSATVKKRESRDYQRCGLFTALWMEDICLLLLMKSQTTAWCSPSSVPPMHWLSCQPKSRKKGKTIAHQLIPKGAIAVPPSPVITADITHPLD